MILFLNTFYVLYFCLGSLYKSLFPFLAKNVFFLKLCLFFVSFLIILNESEINQSFLMISLFSTLLVLCVTLWIACKEFTHFSLSGLTFYRFVFFILSCYFFFVTTFYSLFLLILQYNLDILFFDIILLRFSFLKISSFCYLLFICTAFFSDSVKDKNKFSLSHFYQKFLELLPPVFFAFLLLSLALLTFNTNFFLVYILALLIFSPELKTFYQKFWIPQIQNSSFVWHILRFSSGAPFIFYDFIIASEMVLSGITISKPVCGSPKFLNLARASTSPFFQIASFSTSQRPWVIINDDLLSSTDALIKFTLAQPTSFSANDLVILQESKIFSNSETNNLAAAEVAQSVGLRTYWKNFIMNSDYFFLNENFYISHPGLSSSCKIDQIAYSFANSRKNNFTVVLNALDLNNKNFWFLVTKIENDIFYVKLTPTTNASLNRLVLNEALWKDLSQSDGKLLKKAILISAHDIFNIEHNAVSNITQLKATTSNNKIVYNLGDFEEIKLSLFSKNSSELDLFKNFKQKELLYNRNFLNDPIAAKEIRDFIDERQAFQKKMSNDVTLFLDIKTQAATKLIVDFEKTFNLKNIYDE